MRCFVCSGEMHLFLEKNFAVEDYGGVKFKNIGKCEYVRCENCGLVIAKTIYEMPHEQWVKLNAECHNAIFEGALDYTDVDPSVYERFEIQSSVFTDLVKRGIFKSDWRTVDYGAGDGFLANKTNDKIGKNWLKKFDAYMAGDDSYLPANEMKPASFDFVLTCSVFEHLLGRGDVEKIINLVKNNGVMGLCTVICEEIPQNADWSFYLPVHCTFWTNKAMAEIYKQFGFKRCLYHVETQMWLMFRDVEVFDKIKACASELQGTFVFGEDFVDYWKVKNWEIKKLVFHKKTS